MEDQQPVPPETEVTDRPRRRTFTLEYKRHIIQRAAACNRSGEIGRLLRQEGLYSSHLTKWRQQLGIEPTPDTTTRGRPRKTRADIEAQQLRDEVEALKRKLHQAHAIIAVQKKLNALLEALETGSE
jgi:transposase-like protein